MKDTVSFDKATPSQLAHRLLEQLSVDIQLSSKQQHPCLNASPDSLPPACLPVNTPNEPYCLRCLSKALISRANKKGQGKTKKMLKDFYEQALDVNLTSRLLMHATQHPRLYSINQWVNYSKDIYEATKKLKTLKSRQKMFLLRIKRIKTD